MVCGVMVLIHAVEEVVRFILEIHALLEILVQHAMKMYEKDFKFLALKSLMEYKYKI